MGKNQHVRNLIEGLEAQIAHHAEKIAAELKRDRPDYGVIRHWTKEIETWTDRADRLRDRLPNRR